jgi:hypothetical protein
LDRKEPIVCITFSLAGPLFTLGIDLTLPKPSEEGAHKLILVQPAFRLTNTIVEGIRQYMENAPESKWSVLPEYIMTLMEEADRVEELLIKSLEHLRAHNVSVTMLVWDEDEFLEYTPNLKSRLQNLDVECTPLKLKADDQELDTSPKREPGPFQKHIAIARTDEVCAKLAELI